MTTIINNPDKNTESQAMTGGSGVIIGAVIVILILIGAIVLSVPYLRERMDGIGKVENATINVQLPQTEEPAPLTNIE